MINRKIYFMKHSADNINWRPSCTRYKCVLCTIASLMFVFPVHSINAEETTANSDTLATIEEQVPYEYVIEDRKDPFVPFITEKATTSEVNMDEIVDSQAELTGMQIFEPGQLKLVALMKKEGKDFAMVEDFTGKGYIITIGTKIGKRGLVKNIVPNQVIIEETAQTRAGKKIVSKTVMVLKKEGEE